MYKVFIVDDEVLVIKSLIASIHWRNYGFEVSGESNNGVDALEKILSEKPDLVFTDIRMRGINGLELIKKVKEHHPNIQFVVISGYAEFAYAQKAMNFGALGFCLKPFDENEIVGALLKAKKILERLKSSYQAEFMTLLEDDTPEGKRARTDILKAIGFRGNGEDGLCAAVAIGRTSFDSPYDMLYMNLKVGKNRFVRIMPYIPDIYEEKYGFTIEGNDVKGIGISRVYYTFDDLEKAICEGFAAAAYYFMTGTAGVYYYHEPEEQDFEESLHLLKDCIAIGDYPQAEGVLRKMGRLFANGKYALKHALKLYNTVMYFAHTDEDLRQDSIISSYDQLLEMFTNMGVMMDFLTQSIMTCLCGKQDMISGEVKNEAFKQILQYVNDNYSNDISINKVASKFSVNPSYLSQLFRKEMGETFTEYITRLRIFLASNFLRTTSMTVSEVAENSGYNDYFYFTRVFKKVMGVTPSKYREGYTGSHQKSRTPEQ